MARRLKFFSTSFPSQRSLPVAIEATPNGQLNPGLGKSRVWKKVIREAVKAAGKSAIG